MAFYDALALSSVDLVYVGDILHAARSCVQRRERLAIARELAAGGKGVVLSMSLADVEGDADGVRRLIDESGFPIEAGDSNVVALLGGKVPFVAGSSLACDNGQSLDRLVECGAIRWVLPELCRGKVMRVLSYAGRSNCEIELPVLGHRSNFRWPCRTDRCMDMSPSAHGMPACIRAVATEADMPDWSSDIDTLRAGGVKVLRVAARIPRAVDVAQILSELVDGEIGPDDAYRRYVDSTAGRF